MQVFVYELVTGGGAGQRKPDRALLNEGRAMAAAVTMDFARTSSCQVIATQDARLAPFYAENCEIHRVDSPADERAKIERLAARADRTLVIAPESNGLLAERAQWVLDAGGRLLSPAVPVICLASDKQAMCDHLRQAGVRSPIGCTVTPEEILAGRQPKHIELPAILKPNDGCGSSEIHRIDDWQSARKLRPSGLMRWEPFIPGRAVSVSVLCGDELLVPLPACTQQLSDDGRFTYLGGSTPLSPELNRRAQTLALAAVGTLPQPRGYVGVDLVLGKATDGSDDYVIEINPRLSTSYVGLRALCRENLAAAMLAVDRGHEPTLSWHRGTVQFTADGHTDLSLSNAAHQQTGNET